MENKQNTYDALMSLSNLPHHEDSKKYLRVLIQTLWEDAIGKQSRQAYAKRLIPAIEKASTNNLTPENFQAWAREIYQHCPYGAESGTSGAFVIIDMFIVAYKLEFYLKPSMLFDWVARNIDGLQQLNSYTSHTPDLISSLLSTSTVPSCELLVRGTGSSKPWVQQVQFDTDSTYIRNLLMEVYRDSIAGHGNHHLAMSRLCKFFVSSICFVPRSLDDFTVETFARQIAYFEQIPTSTPDNPSIVLLLNLYVYIIDHLPDDQSKFTFQTGLTRQMLLRPQFAKEWVNGYRAIIHNPMDSVPTETHWILFPNQDELRNSSISPNGYPIDVSYDRDKRLQKILASWLWTECENKMAMRRLPTRLKKLMDTFLIDADGGVRVTSTGTMRWLADLGKTVNRDGIRHHKAWARSFISFGEAQGVLEVEQTVMLMLSMSEKKDRWHADESTAADKDDLKRLATELEARSTDGLFDELIYCAFVVITLTPLRIGEVFDLELDSLSSNAGNIYSIRTSTKVDGSGRSEIQISSRVYKLLSAVIQITDVIRQEAPQEMSNYLFIYRSSYRGSIRKLSGQRFHEALSSACSNLGIEPIGARSIRRRYETEVVLRGVERNLSRLELKPLTGHASIQTTENHYVRDDVREYLEATYGIEIGVPNIRGEVVADEPNGEIQSVIIEENEVEGGAGYCRNEECNIPGTLTCLMCGGFVTTPQCIPEMEEMIANLQIRIQKNATNTHEREHLMTVKRVYLGYLASMYSLKEEERYE